MNTSTSENSDDAKHSSEVVVADDTKNNILALTMVTERTSTVDTSINTLDGINTKTSSTDVGDAVDHHAKALARKVPDETNTDPRHDGQPAFKKSKGDSDCLSMQQELLHQLH